MALSNKNRPDLHAEFIAQIRRFIAGTILFNQQVAEHVGLRLTDMQCINVLDLLGPSTPGQLAQHTGLTTGGVTVMLDRLEKAGFIKRHRSPTDRRSLLIQVNPIKLKKIHAFYAGINKRLGAFLSETPEIEIQLATKFFSRMNAIRSEIQS